MTSRSESAGAPWDPQPGESARAFQAFVAYRDLGPDRSLTKAGEMLGKNTTTIGQWSSKFGWVERARAWDGHVVRLAAPKDAELQAKARARQAATGLTLQDKGLAALAKRVPSKIKTQDAIRMVKVGAELERRALGLDTADEPDGRLAIIAVIKMNLDEL